jgi:hypothetical protein
MKTRKIFLLGFVFLLTGYASVSASRNAGGFYLDARLGGSFLDTPKERDRPGTGLKDFQRTSLSYSFFSGPMWKISPRFLIGAEVGYADNGRATITYASDNEYEFKSTEIDVLGTLTYVTNWNLRLSGKAGVGRTREKYGLSVYVSGTPDLDSEKTRDLFVGAFNVGYQFDNGLEIFVELRRTFGEKRDTVSKALKSTNPAPPPYQDILNSVARVDTISLGLSYVF